MLNLPQANRCTNLITCAGNTIYIPVVSSHHSVLCLTVCRTNNLQGTVRH